MFKNFTFNRLIVLLSTVILVLILLVHFLLNLIFPVYMPDFAKILVEAVTIALGSYLIFRTILDKFLYRRIKLIYKMIRSSKVSMTDEDESEPDEDALGRVEQEVETWIKEQTNEIQSLKQLEAYRRSFIGNVSHELKTPLFTVQGYIHTLLDGGLEDASVNRNFLARAASNVERLQTIVEDLDLVTKLEKDTVVLDKQDFDLKALALDVIHDLSSQAAIKDIELSLKQGASNRYIVHADKEYIRAVLSNLIVNSIKYGNESGQTKIAFYDMDSFILVEVADNGIGISDKHLKHVFDRFYRVDKSRSRDIGGSGLGLSIVKHIMEAHDQTINVRSTKGEGSTFGFTLEKVAV